MRCCSLCFAVFGFAERLPVHRVARKQQGAEGVAAQQKGGKKQHDAAVGELGGRGAQNVPGFFQCGGDFALRRSDGVIAYQLATALDDGLMGITEVVRGRDILPSTPRQLALLRLLGLPAPRYAHFPLLLDSDGERLAKRHQSLTLAALRAQGCSPRAIIGYLGRLAGCLPQPRPSHPRELLPAFDWARVPRDDIRADMSFAG